MAGQFVDANSYPSSKSEIDFFSVPSTQVAIERSSWCVVNPQNTITDTGKNNWGVCFFFFFIFFYRSGPYEFHMPPDPQYIDLSKNYIHLKLKIKRADGTNLRGFATDAVGPINLIGKTFFKQCKLYLGSKLVYDSGDVYAYR